MRLPNSPAVRFLVPALVAFAATFMPWGSVPMSRTNLPDFFPHETFTANAYSSSVALELVKLPNWTPALVLGILALAGWVGAVRPAWTVAAIVYGVAHVAFVARWFLTSGGTISVGTLATLGALVALATTLRGPRARFVPQAAPFGA